MMTGDGVGGLARPLGLVGEFKKLSDRDNFKSEFTGMTNEPQPVDRVWSIEPAVSVRSRRFVQ